MLDASATRDYDWPRGRRRAKSKFNFLVAAELLIYLCHLLLLSFQALFIRCVSILSHRSRHNGLHSLSECSTTHIAHCFFDERRQPRKSGPPTKQIIGKIIRRSFRAKQASCERW